jgi:transcriptional regulator with XRE-family HTH domain
MITGAQIRMARGYLRWSVKELAEAAGVAPSTVVRMEADEGFPIAKGANIQAVYQALIDAGIVFIAGNGHGPGVALRKDATEPAGPSKASRAKRRSRDNDDRDARPFGLSAPAPAHI